MPENTPQRRFEKKTDASYKFWCIARNRNYTKVRYGKIGTKGVTRDKRFETLDEAQSHLEKLIKSKLKSGYSEVIRERVEARSNEELWEVLQPHEPFLQAILNDPDEEDAYLIYADWLSELEDPRAQFIRTQIELSRGSTSLRKRESLEKESNKIRIPNWRSWLGELSKHLDASGRQFDFSRGLLGSISSTKIAPEFARCLRDSPYCRFLRQLHIEISGAKNTIKGSVFGDVLLILAEADFQNIRTFSLIANHSDFENTKQYKSREHAVRIVRAMPRLTDLRLNINFYYDFYDELFGSDLQNLNQFQLDDLQNIDPAAKLADSNWLDQIYYLTLRCNLPDNTCQRLAKRFTPDTLQEVNVFNDRISKKSIQLFEETGVTVNQE